VSKIVYNILFLIAMALLIVSTRPQSNKVLKPSEPSVEVVSNDDNLTFDTLYDKYVDPTVQAKCEGKAITCKEFYLGYATLTQNPKISAIYYKKAYENNVSSLLEDKNAQEGYLLSDLANTYVKLGELTKAKQAYEKAVIAGNRYAICALGRVYRDLNELDNAFDAFTKGSDAGYSECKLDLGTLYYNGIFVAKDQQKGGELWQEAYENDQFGIDTNFNMAVYDTSITHNMAQYKYHLLKAALQGDKEARKYLSEEKLQALNVAPLFEDEAIRKDITLDTNDTNETNLSVANKHFSYGFHLYYRFIKFFNANHAWHEVASHESIMFEKDKMRLIFAPKSLRLETQNTPLAECMEAIKILNDTLYVDTPLSIETHLQNLKTMLEEAQKNQSSLHKSTQIDSILSWSIEYDPDRKVLSYAILLE